MGLWTYEIKIKCENCGMPNKLLVRKGTKVSEFVKSNKCKCKNCGVLIDAREYQTQWLK